MDAYKIEYQEKTGVPLQLNSTFIRPPGMYCKRIFKKDLPISNAKDFSSKATIVFDLNSTEFLDPYSLFLTFDLVNLGKCPLQLDGSAHSLIKKIEVKYKNNGKVLEVIDDYDLLCNLYFDLHLSREERAERKENEGFGDNEYGTNEAVILPEKIDSRSIKDMNIDTENIRMTEIFKEEDKKKLTDEEFYDPYDIPFKPFSQWNHVKNGRVQPEDMESIQWATNINVRKFRLPLLLKTIGHGIQRDNFKYVPMAVLGPIQIIITFNPDGLFVPVPMDKLDYFNQDFTMLLKNYDKDASPVFEYRNVLLEYELDELSPTATDEIYQQVKSGGWILDYKGLSYLNHFYVMPYPTIDGSSEFREKTEIRAMYLIFLTDLQSHTPFSRRLARHNKGFKRIQFQYKNLNKPAVIQDHNSLCTYGEKNAKYFYDQLSKAMSNPNGVISYKNFCLNYSRSEALGLYHYAYTKGYADFNLSDQLTFTSKDWTDMLMKKSKARILLNCLIEKEDVHRKVELLDDFKGKLDEHANKSIFCFNFDDMPYSDDNYRNGLKVEAGDKFKLTLHRINDFQKYDPFLGFNDIYTYLYVFVEYYETIVLDPSGYFKVAI